MPIEPMEVRVVSDEVNGHGLAGNSPVVATGPSPQEYIGGTLIRAWARSVAGRVRGGRVDAIIDVFGLFSPDLAEEAGGRIAACAELCRRLPC